MNIKIAKENVLVIAAIFFIYGLVVPIMVLLLPIYTIAEFVSEKIKNVK